MTTARKIYIALIAAAVLAIASAALGWAIYSAGMKSERLSWQKKEADSAKKFALQLKAEYERGRAASAKYQLGASALQASYLSLEGPSREVLRRVPLLVPGPAAARHPVRDRVVPRAQPGRPAADAAPPVDSQPGVGDHDHLSLAAVWVWNSALAGADAPADSCGLADTSSEACAADSGLTVNDAWANHTLNAKSCAADRYRHRALIEFLTERPAE